MVRQSEPPAGDPEPVEDETLDAPEDLEDLLEQLFRSSTFNAVLAWFFVLVLLSVFVESVVNFDRLWMVFTGAVAVVVVVPAVALLNWRVMLPWELLLVSLLPILVRGLLGGEVGTFASWLAVAGVALIVTVELHMFTSVTLTHWFAVLLVVMMTLASAGAWAMIRWTLDLYRGTNYLTTNEALMTEFVWVTLAGFAAGILFDSYFRRRDRVLRRAIAGVIRR